MKLQLMITSHFKGLFLVIPVVVHIINILNAIPTYQTLHAQFSHLVGCYLLEIFLFLLL